MEKRLLLLQARRPDDQAKEEERTSFALRFGIPTSQLEPWDLLGGVPGPAQLSSYAALVIGGAGDYYVSQRNLPHFEELLHFRHLFSSESF